MFTHEIISYSKNLPIKLFFQRIGDISKHWHQSLELLFVLQGDMSITIDGELSHLSEGDVIVINPQQIHETHGVNCTIAMLQIRMTMFQGPNFYDEAQFNCNSSLYKNKERFSTLKKLLAELINLNSTQSEYDRSTLLTISYTYHIMHELMLHFYVPEGTYSVNTDATLNRIKQITSYINDHYSENITLSALAKTQYLSPSYLSHFFEKTMGMTFSAYLGSVRLDHAYRELMTTDHKIEDIAANCGFPNSRAFTSLFKKQYNMLPSQYRDNSTEHQKNANVLETFSEQHNYLDLEKHDFLSILSQYLEKTPIAASTAQEPSRTVVIPPVSTKDVASPLRHTWRTFTSIGRASDLLKAEEQYIIKKVQKEIGYKYIKFHGILDDSMHLYFEDKHANAVYSFTRVDKAFDFLMSVGLKPLIQLSFMPSALAKNPEDTIFSQPSIISPPKDEGKWSALIENLVSHLVKRYGYNEVKSWIFTFWNETIETTPFSIGDFEYSCHMYDLSFKAVKKVCPDALFTNPSYLAGIVGADVFGKFLEFAEANSCMPDVYLMHFYSIVEEQREHLANVERKNFSDYQFSDFVMRLSEDPELFSKTLTLQEEYASKYINKPFFLTEWNFTSSHRDFLNDTCYRGAYFVKNILENYDRLESFGVWCLSDLLEELNPVDELFHGGIGLFTNKGVPKAAYNALTLLTKLKDNLLKKGENYFITTDCNDNYAIILYNYVHFTNLYAQGILFDASSESRYDVFGEAEAIDIELVLSDAAGGEYSVKETFINRESGSSYDKSVMLGVNTDSEEDEFSALKSHSIPAFTKTTIETIDEKLTIFAHLKPHEVRLIEIKRIY